MYLQHFGLRHAPLGKDLVEPWDDGALAQLSERFTWLLQCSRQLIPVLPRRN